MLSNVIGGPVGAWTSLDHLVGAGEQCRWNAKTESLRGLEIDCKVETGGLLDGKIGRFSAPEYFVDVDCAATQKISKACSVCNKATDLRKLAVY
jgi:hypothetical protein